MKIKALRLGALAGAAMLAVSATASATTLQEMGLSEIVNQSEAIVLGEAISNRTVKLENGIYTLTKFRVDETLSGTVGRATVTVSVPGGSYETASGVRVGEVVAGAPVFFPGIDAVLFLESDQVTGEMCVVGFSQGMMSVSTAGDDVSLSGIGESNISLGSLKSAISAAGGSAGELE